MRYRHYPKARRLVTYVLRTAGLLVIAYLCYVIYVYMYTTWKFHHIMSTLGTDKNYICPALKGRLGNLMFQYASVYGIARKNNLTIRVQDDNDLAQYFDLTTAKIIPDTSVCKSFKRLTEFEDKCCAYDHSLTSLPERTNYIVDAYLQTWRYFDEYFPEVRRELSFKPRLLHSGRANVERFRHHVTCKHGGNVTTVGVHVRLGDILEKGHPRFGYNVAPEGYIQRAVDYFLSRYSCVLFIVCSEKKEMDYVKRIFQYRNVTVQFSELSAIEDFAVLASSDHVIMTTGTFGWWAGFLCGGTVVYYKYPSREGLPLRDMFNYDDHFMPSWVGLP